MITSGDEDDDEEEHAVNSTSWIVCVCVRWCWAVARLLYRNLRMRASRGWRQRRRRWQQQRRRRRRQRRSLARMGAGAARSPLVDAGGRDSPHARGEARLPSRSSRSNESARLRSSSSAGCRQSASSSSLARRSRDGRRAVVRRLVGDLTSTRLRFDSTSGI